MRLATIFALVLSTGCAKKAAIYTGQETSNVQVDEKSRDEADALWAERQDSEKLKLALEKYETLYNLKKDKELGAKLARGWYFYGDAYQRGDVEAQRASWSKAQAIGTDCLKLNAEFAAELESTNKREEAAKMLVIDDIACTYWTSSALGKWAGTLDIATRLESANVAKAYISKIQELNPSFFYSAPNRYWGAYNVGVPSFHPGYNPEKSQKEFKTAIENAPDYLGTRILYAEYWAVKMQDVAVFAEQVQYVLASDPAVLDQALLAENMAEIEKAKELWAARDDKFLDPGDWPALIEQPPKAAPAVESSTDENTATEAAAEEIAPETTETNEENTSEDSTGEE